MSLGLYLLGFFILLAGVAWGLSSLGVSSLWIGIASLILLGAGIMSGVARTRAKDPPEV